ncbi:MAG: integrase arm-type DNA-binding domain-containing protein, partial [Mesorhizobium sp.]
MPVSKAGKPVKISKSVVDGIKPDGTDFYVFDQALAGFGIRVRASGAMSYIAQYRAGAGRGFPVRRITIAKVGKVTPDQARDVAKDLLASVVKGEDPSRDRAEERGAITFAKLAEAFLEHVAALKKANTHAQYAHMLNNYAVPEFKTRKAAAVTPSDIAGLHRGLKAKATTANRVRDVVSSMYGWAIKGKILPKMENPAAGIAKYREAKRERFLSSEEILALGTAIREAETVGIAWEPDPAKQTKHAPKAGNRVV